jgi:hypothetical protein
MMINPILGISVWFLIKLALLVLLSLYLVFSLIIVRQIKLMTSTLVLGFEAPIILLGYIHLAFAILVFIATLVVL